MKQKKMSREEILDFFANKSKYTLEASILKKEKAAHEVAIKSIQKRLSKIGTQVEKDEDVAANQLDRICPDWRKILVS